MNARRQRSPAIRCAIIGLILAGMAGCAAPPPPKPAGPTAEEVAQQARLDRARTLLADGVKAYETGAYDDALKNLLLALDSGLLQAGEQLTARKHLAFTHCVNGRELQCKEEFEKAFTVDAKFELLPTESGHPTWGPLFRLVKTERELKASGKPIPPPARLLSAGEKLVTDGTKAYEDGDFAKALKLLQDGLKESLPAADAQKARKLSAFCYCLTNRMPQCRAEFEKILQIDPKFDLEPAEAGHPSWGPSFRAAKSKTKPAAGK
ncbi:MAG: TssQ family T6SS-associated lipoprotein [Betaproteobacteria bacterium]|nr:TssQ family T6SS-associated lipoprotein [Betaproteobacteria bacterium]